MSRHLPLLVADATSQLKVLIGVVNHLHIALCSCIIVQLHHARLQLWTSCKKTWRAEDHCAAHCVFLQPWRAKDQGRRVCHGNLTEDTLARHRGPTHACGLWVRYMIDVRGHLAQREARVGQVLQGIRLPLLAPCALQHTGA